VDRRECRTSPPAKMGLWMTAPCKSWSLFVEAAGRHRLTNTLTDTKAIKPTAKHNTALPTPSAICTPTSLLQLREEASACGAGGGGGTGGSVRAVS
jgi:hypothetical protein